MRACIDLPFRYNHRMRVHVAVHESQFPDRVRRDLLECLRRRQANHKFHYDSIRQTQKWLALHAAYSPSRTDPDCAASYARAFAAAAARWSGNTVHVVGLGCGGGQKDAALIRLLQSAGREVWYTPCDVSTAMVLVARQAALETTTAKVGVPLVCDFASAGDLGAELNDHLGADSARLFTFLGMIPNFEPEQILPRLAQAARPGDLLLFSANLAPGEDYRAGVERVLPLYDNALTRDWLMSFLLDLGIEITDGSIQFLVENGPGEAGLLRVAAYFTFERERSISIDAEDLRFRAGERFRLFFSYRHTPALVRTLLARHALDVLEEFVTRSGEEGVFLVKRADAAASGQRNSQ